jgi:ERF superfamily
MDEERNVSRLVDKLEQKAGEHGQQAEKTNVEVLLEASLNEMKNHVPIRNSTGGLRKNRKKGQKRQTLDTVGTALELGNYEAAQSAECSRAARNGESSKEPTPLNLRHKLALVRRRLGYIQKRGHNELHNYSYVTAADLSGAVGDILAELGILVIPRLESISHESVRNYRSDGEHLTHVVMSYSFVDVDTAEDITVKVAGEGVDAGDKAPYKAMTGALKYALLQSFLLATGDDPEDERPTLANHSASPARVSEQLITTEELHDLQQLIEETNTEVERVLAYYKLSSLEKMPEGTYRRAVDLLKQKKARQNRETNAHAEN